MLGAQTSTTGLHARIGLAESINREQAITSGPQDALAATISSGSFSGGEVRSFEREWRTRQDSNL